MQSRTLVRTIPSTSILIFALSLLCVPFLTNAAAARPTCTLTAETTGGTYSTTRKADVLLIKGESVTISWKSADATMGERGNGDTLSLSGTATHAPQKTSTYSHHFSNGNLRVTCAISVHVVSGEFTESTLATKSTKPTLSGKASGTKSVQIQIFKEGSEKSLFVSKSIPVKNGMWKTKLTKSLSKGAYDIVLLGEKGVELNTIAKETLTIGTVTKATQKTSGTIVAVSVPLLSGGIARGGASVALSYLQIVNTSKEAATIQGFTIKQSGSASTDTITELKISDDSGSYTNSIQGNGTTPLFKNGTAFIPIQVGLAPGQMRLFTLRATVANTVTAHIGKQLKIDVVGVDTSAQVTSKLPIRGVTWTFGF